MQPYAKDRMLAYSTRSQNPLIPRTISNPLANSFSPVYLMADVINATTNAPKLSPCTMIENDKAEVCPEDNAVCEVPLPPCPSYTPSPKDVSTFKFTANNMVLTMQNQAQTCLGRDIDSFLDDHSLVPDRVLSEKEKEICIIKLQRMEYEERRAEEDQKRQDLTTYQSLDSEYLDQENKSMVLDCIEDYISSHFHDLVEPYSMASEGLSISRSTTTDPVMQSTARPGALPDLDMFEQTIGIDLIKPYSSILEDYAADSITRCPTPNIRHQPPTPAVKPIPFPKGSLQVYLSAKAKEAERKHQNQLPCLSASSLYQTTAPRHRRLSSASNTLDISAMTGASTEVKTEGDPEELTILLLNMSRQANGDNRVNKLTSLAMEYKNEQSTLRSERHKTIAVNDVWQNALDYVSEETNATPVEKPGMYHQATEMHLSYDMRGTFTSLEDIIHANQTLDTSQTMNGLPQLHGSLAPLRTDISIPIPSLRPTAQRSPSSIYFSTSKHPTNGSGTILPPSIPDPTQSRGVTVALSSSRGSLNVSQLNRSSFNLTSSYTGTVQPGMHANSPRHGLYTGTVQPGSYTGSPRHNSYTGTTLPSAYTGTIQPGSYTGTAKAGTYTGVTQPGSSSNVTRSASSSGVSQPSTTQPISPINQSRPPSISLLQPPSTPNPSHASITLTRPGSSGSLRSNAYSSHTTTGTHPSPLPTPPSTLNRPSTPSGINRPLTPSGINRPSTPSGINRPSTPSGINRPSTPSGINRPSTPSRYQTNTSGTLPRPSPLTNTHSLSPPVNTTPTPSDSASAQRRGLVAPSGTMKISKQSFNHAIDSSPSLMARTVDASLKRNQGDADQITRMQNEYYTASQNTARTTMKFTAASKPLTGPPSKPLNGPPSKPLNGPPSKPLNGPPSKPLNGPPSKPLNGPPSKPLNGPSAKFTSAKPLNIPTAKFKPAYSARPSQSAEPLSAPESPSNPTITFTRLSPPSSPRNRTASSTRPLSVNTVNTINTIPPSSPLNRTNPAVIRPASPRVYLSSSNASAQPPSPLHRLNSASSQPLEASSALSRSRRNLRTQSFTLPQNVEVTSSITPSTSYRSNRSRSEVHLNPMPEGSRSDSTRVSIIIQNGGNALQTTREETEDRDSVDSNMMPLSEVFAGDELEESMREM